MLKNKTIDHIRRFRDLSWIVNLFRNEGIPLYRKIDSLLNNQITEYPDILRVLPNSEVIDPYLGDYKWIDGLEGSIDMSISIENGQLFSQFHTTKFKLYWNGESYFYMRAQKFIVSFLKMKKGNGFAKLVMALYIKIGYTRKILISE